MFVVFVRLSVLISAAARAVCAACRHSVQPLLNAFGLLLLVTRCVCPSFRYSVLVAGIRVIDCLMKLATETTTDGSYLSAVGQKTVPDSRSELIDPVDGLKRQVDAKTLDAAKALQ